jgi:predicted hotdog family 3-hydroxylacyl-ACP dehydratase
MAQAVSVFSALELRARGLPPRIGLLLGARRFEARAPYFGVGARLDVHAALVLRDASGLGVFECAIHEQGVLRAQGRVKGYMPENIEDFLKLGAYG